MQLGVCHEISFPRAAEPRYENEYSLRRGWNSSVSQLHVTALCPAILSFLEDREAAKVGVREIDVALRHEPSLSLSRKHETRGRADHRMSQTHDVHACNTLPDFRMRARKIVEDGLFPIIPVFRQQQRSRLLRRIFGQRPIKRPDR